MKVIVDGKWFLVEFAYKSRFNAMGGMEDVTWCFIRDGSVPRATVITVPGVDIGHLEEAPVVVFATVVRYYKDPPNREVARKAALKKALAELDLSVLSVDLDSPEYRKDPGGHLDRSNKARRTLFWSAYLNRMPRKVARRQGA